MTNEVDFVPFAAGNDANVQDQADYVAASSTGSGFLPGQLPSANLNKPLRQGTSMAAALAQFIAATLNEDVLDNGDIAALTSQIQRACGGAGGAPFQSDSFAVSGYGPYDLTKTISGLVMVFFDGIKQPLANYSASGTTFEIAGSVDLSEISIIEVVYAY